MSEAYEFIIAGYGVPGRHVAEALQAQKRSFCVIELNPKTVRQLHGRRSAHYRWRRIAAGDSSPGRDSRRLGPLVIAVPNDEAAFDILRAAKSVNPAIRAVVRCNFSSTGMQALKAGASEVVIAEQVVGQQLTRALMPGHQSHS